MKGPGSRAPPPPGSQSIIQVAAPPPAHTARGAVQTGRAEASVLAPSPPSGTGSACHLFGAGCHTHRGWNKASQPSFPPTASQGGRGPGLLPQSSQRPSLCLQPLLLRPLLPSTLQRSKRSACKPGFPTQTVPRTRFLPRSRVTPGTAVPQCTVTAERS